MASRNLAALLLYENDDYFVINKPSNMSSLDDRSEDITVLSLAKSYSPDAQLCHRLDKETSGALLIAKNPDAYRHASMHFENRLVHKIYHAIVATPRKFDKFLVDLPISKTSTGTVKIDKREGKSAISVFSTLKLFKHYALVECEIATGRMHQIRIHLASQNASIAGDTTYKGKLPMLSELKRKFKSSDEEERPMIQRVALHAFSLRFRGLDGKEVYIEAPYPKDFEVFLKVLEKYDLGG
jgi:23S rRNA pseudouridine955/2504/2580 synthase